MKNIRVKKMLSILLVAVITISSINIDKTNANELVSDKYADIIGLYKTVDETIDILLDRDEYDNNLAITCFVKSEGEKISTDTIEEILSHKTIEYIYEVSSEFDSYTVNGYGKYEFEIDNWYYQVFRVYIRRPYDETRIGEYASKVRYVENSLGLFSEEMCDYEKIAILFKYVAENVDYGSYSGENNQYAYSALIKGKAVCSGYSSLFQDMLNDVGINNIGMTSNECVNPHAWNLVQLEGKWYFCDPTTTYTSSNAEGYVSLGNFMLGSIADSEIAYHEVDNSSNNIINYYNCEISEVNIDGKDTPLHTAYFQICEYKAPTCTETGVYDIACDYCNDRHRIEIPVTHYYTYETISAATCSEDGLGIANCTLCGDSYECTIPKTDHKWNYRALKTTCETDGYEKIYCEDCGEIYWQIETAAYVHEWSQWVEASLMQYKRTCSKCFEEQYEYKSVIDGTNETTTESAITEEDKTPMDRGYGIIAYYSEKYGYWVYEDVEHGPSYVDGETGVWVESLGEYVVWNEDRHRFERIGEVSTTTEKETEIPATTPGTTTGTTTAYNPVTTIEKSTSDIEKEETTTINKEVSSSQEEVTTIVNKPKKVKIHSLKNKKKKSVKMVWKNAKYAKKYQIQYSLSKKFKKGKKYQTKTRTTKKLTLKIKKLKINKTYYFRVRGVNGKVYGKWSAKKKVKIRK